VEYDLDAEDEDWIERYGLGGSKLSDTKFERMLWVLELACAEAQEILWNTAGGRQHRRQLCVRVCVCGWVGVGWVGGWVGGRGERSEMCVGRNRAGHVRGLSMLAAVAGVFACEWPGGWEQVHVSYA
jgi:hypothetical protein